MESFIVASWKNYNIAREFINDILDETETYVFKSGNVVMLPV